MTHEPEPRTARARARTAPGVPKRVSVIAAALALTLAGAPSVVENAQAAPPKASEQVVVLFKHQFADHPATPPGLAARRAAVGADQRRVRASLTASRARAVHTYSALNAVSATVTPAEAARLAGDPSVARVIKNQPIYRSAPLTPTTGTATPGTADPNDHACPGPNDPPSLEPEALQVMSVDSNDPQAKTARSLGYDGSGVKVGVIADGLDPANTEFVRPDGSPVIVDYEDFWGAGLDAPTGGGEAFLDASSIAAQGRNVYDVSHYGAHPLSAPCHIRVEGVAPGASLVMLNPMGPNSFTYLIPWLQAIDYAVTVAHVDVLNESIGGQIFPDDLGVQDAIDAANDAAVAAGITVTVCSGDEGVANTLDHPATDPNVIDVGGSTTYRAAVQTAAHGAQFGVTGWLSDNISPVASAGFSQQGRTLDVVAPADEGWLACTPDPARFAQCFDANGQPTDVKVELGTSEAAPLTAGVAALVIQAYAQSHDGAKPTPAVVKQIITSSADDIDAPAEQQGAGLVDAYRAVRTAGSLAATPPPAPGSDAGAALVESRGQFNAVVGAGARSNFTEQLTNPGRDPLTVHASSRTLGAYTRVKTAHVTLDDATSPKSVDNSGFADNYATLSFRVPANADRLDAAIAYTANPALKWDAADNRAGADVITLIDPEGRLASFSVTISAANHADAQVSDPPAGTWMAYIWGATGDEGGTNGPVLFEASVAHYVGFGAVRPASLTIPAGATRSVRLSVPAPRKPGDVGGSLVLTTGAGPARSVPITVRTLTHIGARFTGLLTGGNGDRTGYEEFTAYYQLDVPSEEPALNALIRLRDDPEDQFFAFLVDPSGQVQGMQSNGVLGPANDGTFRYANDLGAALRVPRPARGRWTLIIEFEPAVSGKELVEPYTVQFDDRVPVVNAPGLPHGQTLAAGATSVVNVRVHNTGPAPVAYFVDPRLTGHAQYDLPVLGFDGTNIAYAVPSRSTALTVTGTSVDGVTPVQIDLGPQTGDPYTVSEPGVTPSLTATGDPLTAGFWVTSAFQIGPFAQPPPQAFVFSDALVTTEAFDPAMASPLTGDPWLWTVFPNPTPPFSPVVAQPGQTVTIPVQITPTAPVGTQVSGTLYVDDENDISLLGFFSPDANTVAAVPYSYTVGA